MSVKRAQQEIDSAEFTEWIAFHNRKPFSFNSVENILSVMAAMLANAFSKKGTKAWKPEDFRPKTRRTPKREDPQVMERKLKSFFKFKHGNHK